MSFDEIYDDLLHEEFRAAPEGGTSSHGKHAALNSLVNPSRSRTVALVGTGGLACAVVGALLGGLGGEFGVTPASAHALNSSSSQFVPLSSVANADFHALAAGSVKSNGAKSGSSTSVGNTVTTLPTALGGVVKGITALAPSDPVIDTSTAPGGITTAADTTSTGSTTPAVATNPVTGAVGDLSNGLTSVLADLTSALSGIVALPGDPSAGLTGVITPLVGVLSDLSNTLTNIITLVPQLPTAVSIPNLPVLTAAAPATTNAPANTSTSTNPLTTLTNTVTSATKPIVSALSAPLSTPPAANTGSSGSGLPSLPTVQLPIIGGLTLPSLPVSVPSLSSLPSLPDINLPILPTTSTAPPTCVSTPALPTSPLPSVVNGTITLGPISVGLKVGGTTSATICATG